MSELIFHEIPKRASSNGASFKDIGFISFRLDHGRMAGRKIAITINSKYAALIGFDITQKSSICGKAKILIGRDSNNILKEVRIIPDPNGFIFRRDVAEKASTCFAASNYPPPLPEHSERIYFAAGYKKQEELCLILPPI